MGRIIVTVVFVVVLAVLVSMNLGFTTSVNLFGFRFDNVSVVAVAALSFAVGVVYSLLIYIGRFLHHRTRRGLANRDRALTEREKDLASRQADAPAAPATDHAPDTEGGREETDGRKGADDEPGSPSGSRRTGFARLLDFFRLRP